MFRNYKYEKGYNIFYPSSHKKFIEISAQFEEEPMHEIELVKGECSHTPINDYVSDDYFSEFYDSNMEYEYYYMKLDHDAHIIKKWDDKTRQAAGDLAGDPLDSRNTRSQFHNALLFCELNNSNS